MAIEEILRIIVKIRCRRRIAKGEMNLQRSLVVARRRRRTKMNDRTVTTEQRVKVQRQQRDERIRRNSKFDQRTIFFGQSSIFLQVMIQRFAQPFQNVLNIEMLRRVKIEGINPMRSAMRRRNEKNQSFAF